MNFLTDEELEALLYKTAHKAVEEVVKEHSAVLHRRIDTQARTMQELTDVLRALNREIKGLKAANRNASAYINVRSTGKNRSRL